MAIDACHVIYEIRITRELFKWNPEPGQTKRRVEGIFFITAVCLQGSHMILQYTNKM